MIKQALRFGIAALTLALAALSVATYAESAATGTATWYGPGFHGSFTANGEVFNTYDPTIAAASVYPLGSYLRVTNVANGRSTLVRVNDIGGFDKINPTTVLDLSYAAFARIADPDDGRIRVEVEPLSAPQAKLIQRGGKDGLEPAATPSAKGGNAAAPASRFVAY